MRIMSTTHKRDTGPRVDGRLHKIFLQRALVSRTLVRGGQTRSQKATARSLP